MHYEKSIELLLKCSTEKGFVASAQDISNYKRVWARDGVICGLSALASGHRELIKTFKNTLLTLAKHQHEVGTIPSNVGVLKKDESVSYGGLAGRVDAATWFVIGVCQYANYTNDFAFFNDLKPKIYKVLQLLNAWEFNNKHLMYIPLSGNWADEYITDGYVLYDQLLRYWAIQSFNYLENDQSLSNKLSQIKNQIKANFFPNSNKEKFHDRAYNAIKIDSFLPCSFSPSGYKTNYDAFANALLLILDFGDKKFKNKLIDYSLELAESTKLGLLPAFWPIIKPNDQHWDLLKDNCKYEFRNYPYEFHNGGSWAMVNGFFGLGLLKQGKTEQAKKILKNIDKVNQVEDYKFYENFNTKTTEPNGVPYCAWSAAASVLLTQSIKQQIKFI